MRSGAGAHGVELPHHRAQPRPGAEALRHLPLRHLGGKTCGKPSEEGDFKAKSLETKPQKAMHALETKVIA